MRELPDAVFRLAGHLVLDSEFARYEVGDAIRPVEQGILTERDLFPIGKVREPQRAHGCRACGREGSRVKKGEGEPGFGIVEYHKAVRDREPAGGVTGDDREGALPSCTYSHWATPPWREQVPLRLAL